jgi:hypothetical protein
MGMHEPKAAQTPPSPAALWKIRYEKRTRPANEHGFNAAVAAYEQSYLTSGFE